MQKKGGNQKDNVWQGQTVKKNWKGKIGVQITAMILVLISGIGLIVGSVMMYFAMDYYDLYGNDKTLISQGLRSNLSANYSSYLFNTAKETGLLQETFTPENESQAWDALEESALTYGVERISYSVDSSSGVCNVERDDEFVYDPAGLSKLVDDFGVKKSNDISAYDYFLKSDYSYNLDSLKNAVWVDVMTYPEDGYDHIFLVQGDGGYVLENEDASGEDAKKSDNLDSVKEYIYGSIPSDGIYVFYRIYMVTDLQNVIDAATDKENTVEASTYLKEKSSKADYMNYDDRYLSIVGCSNWMSTIELTAKNIQSVKFADGTIDYYWLVGGLSDVILTVHNIYLPIFMISLVLLILSFVLLMVVSGHRRDDDAIHLSWLDRTPYVICLIVAIVAITLGVLGNIGIAAMYLAGTFALREFVAFSVLFIIFWGLVAELICMTTVTRIKAKALWKTTLCYYIFDALRKHFGNVMRPFFDGIKKNISESIRIGFVLAVVAIAEIFLLNIASRLFDVYYYPNDLPAQVIVLFIVFKIVEAIVIYKIFFAIKKITEGASYVANGDFEHPITTDKMPPTLKQLSEKINLVGKSTAKIVEEQMKSERLKTELITNVSHDIKTPLTSIISYVDLIKKEDIAEERIIEYVEVLDRQSARLKKLIEDLLEASKASTGNIDIELERCNVSTMISQVTAEYQERLEKNNIDLVVNAPKDACDILADGRHLWRVLDNLLSNILKYTQENTRVYVDQSVADGKYYITFKNTSKYPLNITSDELMERFVRGDESRNTEGYGLGLSIAESLMKLMGGSLLVEIDGDLFKVTLDLKLA